MERKLKVSISVCKKMTMVMMFYIYWVRLCLVNDAKIFFPFII